jgi:hypothetical protein
MVGEESPRPGGWQPSVRREVTRRDPAHRATDALKVQVPEAPEAG